MVKNNFKNILKLFLFTFIIFQIFNIGVCEAKIEDPFENADTWAPTLVRDDAFAEKAGKVLGIINGIGIVTGVLVATGLGIKFMLGSVEEKATYKKDFIPYIVGIFMLVLATTLPNIIYIFTTNVLDMNI